MGLNAGRKGVRDSPGDAHQRQAALHDCLPRLLGNGDTEIEIVYGEKKKYFVLSCRPEHPRQNKSHLYRHDEPNEPTKE
jgi:hypothetical protein